jgi:hypothetical protein
MIITPIISLPFTLMILLFHFFRHFDISLLPAFIADITPLYAG